MIRRPKESTRTRLDRLLRDFLDERERYGEAAVELETGLTDLDIILGGMRHGETVLSASAPGVGRTALAQQVALHASKTQGAHVLWFSMGVGARHLALRWLVVQSGIEARRIRGLGTRRVEPGTLEASAAELSRLSLSVEPSPLTLRRLREEVLRWKAELGGNAEKLKLVVVDGLRAMPTKRGERDADLLAGLCELGREAGVVLWCSTDVPRCGVRRLGALLELPDVVCVLQRNDGRGGPVIAMTVRVVANRRGDVGDVDLDFEPSLLRFRSTERGLDIEPLQRPPLVSP